MFEDPYEGWRDTTTGIDIAVVRSIRYITNEDEFSDLTKQGAKYSLLKDLSKKRIIYLFTLQKLTGNAGVLTDVPFIMTSLGQAGAINGGIPTEGQMVLVLYVGKQQTPYCIGGIPYRFLDLVSKGTIPILRPGEQIVQSEVPEDPFDSENINRKPGAIAYWDYKGRLILKAVQTDGTIDGTVEITLGNPIEDEAADEDQHFVTKDLTTDKEIVFRLKTASGVTINIDREGNVHSEVLKDYIKSCVNEFLEVSGKFQLTCSDIRLGGEDVDQRLVLGEVWKQLMEELFTAIQNMTLNHPMGPTLSPPINWTEFKAVKDKLETALSEISKTKKS